MREQIIELKKTMSNEDIAKKLGIKINRINYLIYVEPKKNQTKNEDYSLENTCPILGYKLFKK